MVIYLVFISHAVFVCARGVKINLPACFVLHSLPPVESPDLYAFLLCCMVYVEDVAFQSPESDYELALDLVKIRFVRSWDECLRTFLGVISVFIIDCCIV